MGLLDEALKEARDLEKQVYIDGNCIVINVTHEYNIALSRCDTPEKLLGWVWHLCEKTWITRKVLCRFIEVASEFHNISISVPA